LARFGGASCEVRAASAAALMEGCGLDAGIVEGDDAELWQRQRGRQRSVSGPLGERGAIVRVSGQPAELARVIRSAARAGGALVGPAGVCNPGRFVGGI